ncbi:response regulator [Hufsiella ginkgonis]|uniref:Response regulator n=1 Tax=Hufsiella ginkgonis TaxID=2695274 RepID=A0A7K1Y0C9_9SPHI|nr:response regulator [Hufsiella ginkgonis]MXV16652.1 response regulator [Hufsiella ginkgonis]
MNKRIDIACVIDDDEIYTYVVKKMIAVSGIATKTLYFTNGKMALDFFQEYIHQGEQLPDLILLDINMPVMDGWQFMHEFVKFSPLIKKRITIYIVSSSVDEDDHKRAESIELVSGYVVKPITMEVLKTLIKPD